MSTKYKYNKTFYKVSEEFRFYHTAFNLYDAYDQPGRFFYIYNPDTQKWVRFFPDFREFNRDPMPAEMRQFLLTTMDYVIPVESGYILITGKNFEGEERNRLAAAGFIIWDLSAGKVTKSIKVIGKVSSSAIEGMVKTFKGKAVRETAEKAVKIDNILDPKAVKAAQEAITKGEIDEELFEELAEEINDIATKKRKKLSWEEVKILFKKGKDFEILVSSKIKTIPPFSTLFKDYTHLKQIYLRGVKDNIIAEDLFVKQVRDERGRTYFRAVISDSKLTKNSPWTANQKSELIDVFKKDPNKKYIEFEVRSDDKYLPKDLQGNIKIRIHREDVYKIISEGDNIKTPPIKMF